MESGSVDPSLPEFLSDGDPLNDLNFLEEFMNTKDASSFMNDNDIGNLATGNDINQSLAEITDAEKFNHNELISIISNQAHFASPERIERNDYAGSVDSGAGSLSPTSSENGSPISTPIYSNGQIALSIQPHKLQRSTASKYKKASLKSKKVIPKIEVCTTEKGNEMLDNLASLPGKSLDSDTIQLTVEEQEVLDREGWELSEKNIKKARRKIKNKISAQESRKRKRDYVNNLEERLTDFTNENQQLKTDLEKERSEKKSILSQLRELQSVVGSRFQAKSAKTSSTQTSAAVVVVLLCFSIFKGTFSPAGDELEEKDGLLHEMHDEFDYSTPNYKSRVLKCFTDENIDFCQMEDGIDLPVVNFDQSDDSDSDDPDPDMLHSQFEKLKLNKVVPSKNLSAPEIGRGGLMDQLS